MFQPTSPGTIAQTSIGPVETGDLVVLSWFNYNTTTPLVSLTDSANAFTWTRQYQATASGSVAEIEIWTGVATTAVSTTTTVTATAPSSNYYDGVWIQFRTALGASTVWSPIAANNYVNTTSSTTQFGPTLTATAPGTQLFCGMSVSTNGFYSVSNPGFSYASRGGLGPVSKNDFAFFNTSLLPGSIQPSISMSAASTITVPSIIMQAG